MDFEDIRMVAVGYQPAKLLLAALDLGVFDLLSAGPLTSAEIGTALAVDARATEIAGNALVALGFLEKEADRFCNAEGTQRFLVASSPQYKGEILRHIHAMWEDWNELSATWRQGTPQRQQKTQNLPLTEEGIRNFILGMENLTRELAPKLAGMLPLQGLHQGLDLGGGPGNYCLAFVRQQPGLRMVHFDLPATSQIAREFVAGKPGSDRVSFAEGDFLADPLGTGFDFVWASQIIHMLDEDAGRALIRRVAEALTHGGLLAVHDQFLDAGMTSPRPAAMFGVHMLVATERGRTYSLEEVEGWMVSAGIEPADRIDYGGGARILLGRRRADR